jgi:hypothetical protein
VTVTPSQRLRNAALGAALLAAACQGKVVDLSNQADPDTDHLATTNDQVLQLAVDDQRLYWASFTNLGNGALIRSCEKPACEKSQVAYAREKDGGLTAFGVQSGQVFWFRAVGSSWDLVACNVAGCQGEPRIVAELPSSTEAGLREAVFDDRFAYYFGQSESLPNGDMASPILRTPLSDQDGPASRIATAVSVVSLAVHDDYVYWLGFDPYTGRASNPGFVERVRKDGSAAPERLVSNLELVTIQSAQRSAHLGLAVDDNYFYWSRNALLGAILRCPLDGCTGAPDKVASPTRFPLGLFPDGPNLHWTYRSDVSSYSIATCASSACQPALGIIQGSTSANVLTSDEEYLYTATTETPFDNYDQWTRITSTIRRFPK